MGRYLSTGLLFICFCLVINANPWFPRPPPSPPPPPGPVIPDAFRFDLLKHLASLHIPDKLHSHHKAKRHRGERFRKSARPLVIAPVDHLRSYLDDYDALDDEEELPIVIQKVSPKAPDAALSSMALLDKTPVDVEALHLIQRLLKGESSIKKKKKPKPVISGKAHHIIITQGPSETVTTIQAPVNACVPAQNNGIGGTPRAATPIASPQPIPNIQPPVQVTPTIQTPSQPRSEVPTSSNPTNSNPMSIVTTQTQSTFGPSTEKMSMMQPSLATLAPVLAEIGALVLGVQPALGLADLGHGHHKLGHVALAQPALAAPATLALPVSATYGNMYPVAQQEQTSSITSDLYNLLNTLQQQGELQRQQLAQQQQLQQENQDLLQQQRSQLAQMQQPPQVPAVQPIFPQPAQTDLQGRSVFPTGDQTTPTVQPTPVLSNDVLQQLLQPSGVNSVVSTATPTIITLTTGDDDLSDQPTGYHTTKHFRKRKKFLTRKLLHNYPFLY